MIKSGICGAVKNLVSVRKRKVWEKDVKVWFCPIYWQFKRWLKSLNSQEKIFLADSHNMYQQIRNEEKINKIVHRQQQHTHSVCAFNDEIIISQKILTRSLMKYGDCWWKSHDGLQDELIIAFLRRCDVRHLVRHC